MREVGTMRRIQKALGSAEQRNGMRECVPLGLPDTHLQLKDRKARGRTGTLSNDNNMPATTCAPPHAELNTLERDLHSAFTVRQIGANKSARNAAYAHVHCSLQCSLRERSGFGNLSSSMSHHCELLFRR